MALIDPEETTVVQTREPPMAALDAVKDQGPLAYRHDASPLHEAPAFLGSIGGSMRQSRERIGAFRNLDAASAGGAMVCAEGPAGDGQMPPESAHVELERNGFGLSRRGIPLGLEI